MSRIDDEAARTGEQAFPGGFEDGRLFRWKSAWWFSATVVVDFAPVRAKIVLCRLAGQRVTECYEQDRRRGGAHRRAGVPGRLRRWSAVSVEKCLVVFRDRRRRFRAGQGQDSAVPPSRPAGGRMLFDGIAAGRRD